MKMFAKFITLVLSICMLAMPLSAFATSSEPRLSVGMGEDDVIKVPGTEVAVSDAGYYVQRTSSEAKNNQITVSYHITNAAVFKIPFPQLPAGQSLDEVYFRFGSAKEAGYKLVKIPGTDFAPADLRLGSTTGSTPLVTVDGEVIVSNLQNAENNAIDNASTTSAVTSVNAAYLNTTYIQIADISTYAKECYERNQEYFYILIYNSGSTTSVCSKIALSNIVNGTGYNYLDLNPYLYYTTEDAEPMELVSSTPSNGSDNILTNTPVSFVFNHSVKSATATINGEDVAVVVNDNTVSLEDITLGQYADYMVSVTATDIYNSIATSTISFSTSVALISETMRDGSSWSVGASQSDALADATISLGAGGKFNNIALYKISLTGLNGKIPASFDFSWVQSGSGNRATLIKFEGENWDVASMTTGDDDVFNILNNNLQYQIPWNGEMTNETITWSNGSTTTVYRFTNDISAYVGECLENNQEYAYVGLIQGWTCAVYGFAANANKSATYKYTAIEPEMKTINADVNISGRNLEDLSFELLTKIDDIEENVVLKNVSTNSVVAGVKFEYDKASRIISLSEPVLLDEMTDYKVVILGGIEDIYGNALSSNYDVTAFTTGTDIIVMKSKIVSASTEVTDYDELINLEALDSDGCFKAVNKISNNTSDDITFMLVIAKYNSENLMTDVALKPGFTVEAGSEDVIVESNELEINGSGDFVKAFIWIEDDIHPICVAAKSIINK